MKEYNCHTCSSTGRESGRSSRTHTIQPIHCWLSAHTAWLTSIERISSTKPRRSREAALAWIVNRMNRNGSGFLRKIFERAEPSEQSCGQV